MGGWGEGAQNADWPVFIQRNFYKVAGKWIGQAENIAVN
jgi:hypothetical protein